MRIGEHEMNAAEIEQKLEQLERKLAQAESEQEKLISIIMQETDVCLFGGGAMRDGLPRRNSCRFWHPGCACADWIDAHRPDNA